MPWFKIDDTFAMHEKVMAAGNSAVGLWARAGAWSMQQLTDGFVPNHVLRALGTPKERRSLVEVSLWVEVEGGIRFKNWEERQPTKIQVEAARQAATDRQRHARERAKSQRESRRDMGVSHGPPDPTRPDPTPKDKEPSRATALNKDDRFNEFWDIYDHKLGRKKAESAWRSALKKPGIDADLLILAASQYIEWLRSEGKHPQFTKHASTWLNGEHWTDERAARSAPQSRAQQWLQLASDLGPNPPANVREIGPRR